MAQQLGWHFGTCSTGHHNFIPRVDDLTGLDNLPNQKANDELREKEAQNNTQIDPPPGNARSCQSLRSIGRTRRELAIEDQPKQEQT